MMSDEDLNLFEEYAAECVHICVLRKNSVTLLPEGPIKCTQLAP